MVERVALVLSLLVCVYALRQQSPLSKADQLDVALQEAQNLGRSCSVAIGSTDGKYAKFFARMDSAPTASVELSLARAFTAFEFNAPTSTLTVPSSPFGRYFNMQVLGTYASGPGGFPLSGGSSVGVACEFDSTPAILAADTIASAVVNATQKVKLQLPDIPAIGSVITLNQARFISDFILSNIGSKQIAVAIVDAESSPKLVTSTDNVPNAFIRGAVRKAISARRFDLPESSKLNDVSEPGQPAYGVQITNGGLFPIMGASIILNGAGEDVSQAIGAVGIEGELSETEAAQAVANALQAFYARGKVIPQVTLRNRRGITAMEAQEAIRAAIAARKSLGENASPGVYAVRDISGYLRAFYYEDGVEKGAPDIALKSSLATAIFRIPSENIGANSQPNLPLFNIELLYGGLVSFESAYPLTNSDGTIIGAIGVSGTGQGKGTANDGFIARASASALSKINDPCAQSVGMCLDTINPITPPNISTPSMFSDEIISLAQVAALIDAAQKYGLQNTQAACASVFDAGVRLKGHLCSNDAFLGATDLSQRKSISGQAFGKANQELQQGQIPGGVVYKIEISNGGLFFNGGGSPLKISGHTVASVGVAGAADDIAAVTPSVQLWNSVHPQVASQN